MNSTELFKHKVRTFKEGHECIELRRSMKGLKMSS